MEYQPLACDPCDCPKHASRPYKPLTILALDCWQRIYDKRPYSCLLLSRKLFEETYHRPAMDDLDFTCLLDFINSRNSLTAFELNYMPIPESVVVPLLSLLAPNMQHISLCHTNLPLSTALNVLLLEINASECHIRTLRLSGNEFGDIEHAELLRRILFHPLCKLIYLDVGYCNLDAQSFSIIADGMLNCPSLKAIDVSHIQPIHSHHATDVAKLALTMSCVIWPNRLREFHARQCCLDGHDIVHFTDGMMQRCTNLTYLDLCGNNLGCKGADNLFDAMREAPHLIGLNIANNNIGPHGAGAVSNWFSSTGLRFLDIARNGIPAAEMRLILNTLRKYQSIEILNIYGNEFDASAADVLRRVIDARVLLLYAIDATTTYDSDTRSFRVVPTVNDSAECSYRYNRVVPFHRRYDAAPNLQWHNRKHPRTIRVNGLYLDAIYVDKNGRVYTMDKWGRRQEPECTRVFDVK